MPGDKGCEGSFHVFFLDTAQRVRVITYSSVVGLLGYRRSVEVHAIVLGNYIKEQADDGLGRGSTGFRPVANSSSRTEVKCSDHFYMGVSFSGQKNITVAFYSTAVATVATSAVVAADAAASTISCSPCSTLDTPGTNQRASELLEPTVQVTTRCG